MIMLGDVLAGSGERYAAYLVSSLVHVASSVVVHPQHGDQPVGHPVGLNNSQHKVRVTHTHTHTPALPHKKSAF